MSALQLVKDASDWLWNLLAHSKLTPALFLAVAIWLVSVGWWGLAPATVLFAMAAADRHWSIT